MIREGKVENARNEVVLSWAGVYLYIDTVSSPFQLASASFEG